MPTVKGFTSRLSFAERRRMFENDFNARIAEAEKHVPEPRRNRWVIDNLAAKYGFWYTFWQMVGR